MSDELVRTTRAQCVNAWREAWWNKVPHTALWAGGGRGTSWYA